MGHTLVADIGTRCFPLGTLVDGTYLRNGQINISIMSLGNPVGCLGHDYDFSKTALKVPATNRHCYNMTEKLSKATLILISTTE